MNGLADTEMGQTALISRSVFVVVWDISMSWYRTFQINYANMQGTPIPHARAPLNTAHRPVSTSSTVKRAVLHESSLCIFLGAREAKNERCAVEPCDYVLEDLRDELHLFKLMVNRDISWTLCPGNSLETWMAQSSSNTMFYKRPRSFFLIL